MRRTACAVLVAAALLAGCSSSSGGADDAGADGALADTAVEASSDAPPAMCLDAGGRFGATCNMLTLTGASITPTDLGAIAPIGGMIVDGEYVLTAFVVAGGATDVIYRQRLSICSGTLQVVKELKSSGATLVTTATSTFTLAGTQITLTPSCGSFWDGTSGYDATPTSLVIYGQGDHALTFTRQ